MSQLVQLPFLEQFAALRDPRQASKVLYSLPELLLLLLCGAVSGADDFVELTLWGEEHLPFLRRFLPFARGTPSHDRLCEVIAAVDPTLFKTCFTNWVERLRMTGPETIAIDGKTSQRSHARSKGRRPASRFRLNRSRGLGAGGREWRRRRHRNLGLPRRNAASSAPSLTARPNSSSSERVSRW
jgi:hypothetical protein